MRMRFSMKKSHQLLADRGIGAGHPVQLFIAQSCIRRMRKYTPQDTGMLANSATVQAGGMQIWQKTPYARKQYYDTSLRHKGMQTSHWFQVMLDNGGRNAILREARIRSGAGG